MNAITEATKSTIHTIKIRALLSKALAADPKPTPGYLFPEIANATKTPGGSEIILAHLLRILTPSRGRRTTATTTTTAVFQGVGGTSDHAITTTTSTDTAHSSSSSSSAHHYDDSVHVLLKALKILRQLAQSGSVDLRMQLARQGKHPLALLVGFRGDWDPVHGDQFNLNVRQTAEDLIEYLHAHPVQEHELVAAATVAANRSRPQEQQQLYDEDGGFEPDELLSVKETELLKSSTQGLSGFGNPGSEDSSDEEQDRADRVGRRRRRRHHRPLSSSSYTRSGGGKGDRSFRDHTPPPEPPLPGFGNDPLDDGGGGWNRGVNRQEPRSLMDRLVDRLQELTAPPPPMAIHAAKRQQERRRQKLFVGEYSMADETPMAEQGVGVGVGGRGGEGEGGGSGVWTSQTLVPPSLVPTPSSSPSLLSSPAATGKGSTVSIMGTNPFRRFPRKPGQILGGWAEPGEELAHTQKWNRTASGPAETRHPVSRNIYQLAQSIQTGYIRTCLPRRTKTCDDAKEQGRDEEEEDEEEEEEEESGFMLWGAAKVIGDTVFQTIVAEQAAGEKDPPLSTTASPSIQLASNLPVITGLLRDMNDWIEQEDWDRRLKYLHVLDTLLAHARIQKEILNCPSISILMTTLEGPKCIGAMQRSVSRLSIHLSRYLKLAQSFYRQYPHTLPSNSNHDLLVDV